MRTGLGKCQFLGCHSWGNADWGKYQLGEVPIGGSASWGILAQGEEQFGEVPVGGFPEHNFYSYLFLFKKCNK